MRKIKKWRKNKRLKYFAFTLIELLVVIAIIGMLSAIVLVSLNTSREKSRDSRRMSDIRQILTAMALYYNDNSAYPDQAVMNANPTLTSIGPSGSASTQWQDFISTWPTAPTPADGTCAAGPASVVTTSTNQYTYWGRNALDNESIISDPPFFRVTFCTGKPIGNYPAGELRATPSGIYAN